MQYFLCLSILFCSIQFCSAAESPTAIPNLPFGFSIDSLNKLYEQKIRTGVKRDDIPALSKPQFLSVSDAALSLSNDDIVFLVFYPNGRIRIYPQRVLVWHEIVNDIIPDQQGQPSFGGSPEAEKNAYCISYCPLSGTVVGFKSRAGSFFSEFGIVGDLLNNNSILYDAASYSEWSQLLGLCLNGPLQGKRLERIQVLWARWKGVQEKYVGKAEVLSISTGYKRSYGKDPYGSYQSKGNYYDDNRILYPLTNFDPRLPPKTHILGLEQENSTAAVQVAAVKNAVYLNFTFGVTPLLALYDEQLDAVRIFERRTEHNAQVLQFEILDGVIVDSQSKSRWTREGVCTYGQYRDKQLLPFLSIDSMWFVWAAFHRDSLIFPSPQ